MKKVAVVLRGHIRSWNFVKHNMFHVFESRYENIDWYFSTWEDSLSPRRRERLQQDFQGKNFHLYSTPDSTAYSSWKGPGLLCEQVVPAIMNNNYDAVFETRPDIFVEIKEELPQIENNSIYVTGIDVTYSEENGMGPKIHQIGAQDWFFIFDAPTFSTYAQRRFWEGPDNSHGSILSMARKNDINIYQIKNYIHTIIVRPNIFQNPTSKEWLWEHGPRWINLSRDEKIHHVNLQDIAHVDYMTNNLHVSL